MTEAERLASIGSHALFWQVLGSEGELAGELDALSLAQLEQLHEHVLQLGARISAATAAR